VDKYKKKQTHPNPQKEIIINNKVKVLENSAVCMYMSFYFLSIAPIEQNIIIY
jgi:hypothetical protein